MQIEIRLVWSPDPRIEFMLADHSDFGAVVLSTDRADLDLTFDLGPKGTVTGQSLGWSYRPGAREGIGDLRMRGRIYPCSLGGGNAISRVEFSLANLRGLVDGATLGAGGWQVRLEAPPQAETRSGYAATHRGTLERADGASFSSDDTGEVLECLRYCLAFASGGWVGVLLPVGRGVNGRTRWQRWEVSSTDEASLHRTWLPPRMSGLALASLWGGFRGRWETPEGRSAIRTLVPIFVEAEHMKTAEAGLVLNQIGLDLLSWIVVVEGRGVIREAGYEKLDASDHVRLLLRPSGVDLSVPNALKELARACPDGRGWRDGADAITDIRNTVVHARKRRERQVADSAVAEAGVLAHDYWLRGLLGYFDYDGEYRSRVAAGIAHTP